MQQIFINLLFQIIQRIVGGEFFSIIKDLVLAAASSEYKDIAPSKQYPAGLTANQQRKLAVTAQLYRLQGDVGAKASEMGGWLVSMAIDAAVGKLRKENIIQ